MKTIYSCDLGQMDFRKSWQIQTQLHERCVAGDIGGAVLCVEHPEVLTMGKNSSLDHLLLPKKDLEVLGIEIVDTDRGGEITGHEPGQLVLYGILPLAELGLSPKKYVCLLEGAIIDTLAEFGIESKRDTENPGVWVGSAKVAAIGVRVKKRVSLHGIALNVCNSLKIFEYIVPCGIKNRSMTSITELLNRPVTVSEVAHILKSKLSESLGALDSIELDELKF